MYIIGGMDEGGVDPRVLQAMGAAEALATIRTGKALRIDGPFWDENFMPWDERQSLTILAAREGSALQEALERRREYTLCDSAEAPGVLAAAVTALPKLGKGAAGMGMGMGMADGGAPTLRCRCEPAPVGKQRCPLMAMQLPEGEEEPGSHGGKATPKPPSEGRDLPPLPEAGAEAYREGHSLLSGPSG